MLWMLACLAPPADPPLPAPALPPSAPVPVATAPELVVRELARARLVATGDLLLHETVQKVAARRGNYEALFAGTRPLVEEADLAFVNLESPVAPRMGKPIKPLEFNAPPEVLAGLKATGFDLLSFANNHVYDQGRDGFVETLDHLDEAGLPYIGAGRTCAEAGSARTFEVGELKLVFLGSSKLYNDRLNAGPGEPCADTFELQRALATVRQARDAGADAVIFSIHWGVEYQTRPTEEQVEIAHALLEGGVDLVLGHHPHVLQPIEVRHLADGRVGVIAYSLGNYVSNQSAWYEPGLNPVEAANPRDGVLLGLSVVRREYGLPSGKSVVRIELADLGAVPLWTRNNGTTRGKDGVPDISVEPLVERIAQLRAELASATSDSEIVKLAGEINELERRWKQVSKILGEQFLVPRN